MAKDPHSLKSRFSNWHESVEDNLFNMFLTAEMHRSGLDRFSGQVRNKPAVWYASKHPQGEPVVMVHGFSADKTCWLKLAGLLGQEYNIMIPDLPGHGETGTHHCYRLESMVDWLDEWFDAVGIESAHIMGSSMGGGIAAWYAWKHPERIRSLTLISNAGIKPPILGPFMQEVLETGRNRLVHRPGQDLDDLLNLVMARKPWIPKFALKAMEREMLNREALNDAIFANLIESFEDLTEGHPRFETLLEDGPSKILALWGQDDQVLHVSSTEVIKQVRPDAEIIIMKNIGHAPMLEAPKLTARFCHEFMQGVISEAG
ncbi:alpha/beta fold hydrolase [Endozoicomonadaceae bacterium StTr2]